VDIDDDPSGQQVTPLVTLSAGDHTGKIISLP
jgi:hypothetical protein